MEVCKWRLVGAGVGGLIRSQILVAAVELDSQSMDWRRLNLLISNTCMSEK